MLRATSIRADELSARVQKVSGAIVKERAAKLGIDPGKVEICCFPGVGTVGLILRDVNMGNLAAGDLFEMADVLTDQLDGFADGGAAKVDILRDVITMGYFPNGPIVLDRLQ